MFHNFHELFSFSVIICTPDLVQLRAIIQIWTKVVHNNKTDFWENLALYDLK